MVNKHLLKTSNEYVRYRRVIFFEGNEATAENSSEWMKFLLTLLFCFPANCLGIQEVLHTWKMTQCTLKFQSKKSRVLTRGHRSQKQPVLLLLQPTLLYGAHPTIDRTQTASECLRCSQERQILRHKHMLVASCRFTCLELRLRRRTPSKRFDCVTSMLFTPLFYNRFWRTTENNFNWNFCEIISRCSTTDMQCFHALLTCYWIFQNLCYEIFETTLRKQHRFINSRIAVVIITLFFKLSMKRTYSLWYNSSFLFFKTKSNFFKTKTVGFSVWFWKFFHCQDLYSNLDLKGTIELNFCNDKFVLIKT